MPIDGFPIGQEMHVTYPEFRVSPLAEHWDGLLGGLLFITFQMSTASQDSAAMRRSIELLGNEVAPVARSIV